MKVLHLNLKKKWFDAIASGDKKHEYRDVKPYWITRFVQTFGAPHSCEDFNFTHLGYKMSMEAPVHYDVVEFKNGYKKDAPTMQVEIKDITVDIGKEKWGAELGKSYFVIKLGTILSIKNYESKNTLSTNN